MPANTISFYARKYCTLIEQILRAKINFDNVF
jgi:hypothetical protein